MSSFASIALYYKAFLESLGRRESIQLLGLAEAQRIAFLDMLIADWRQGRLGPNRRLILVHSDPKQLVSLEGLLHCNAEEDFSAVDVQAYSIWGFQRYLQQEPIRAARIQGQTELVLRESEDAVTAPILLTSFAGLMQTAAAPDVFRSAMLSLAVEQDYDIDQLMQALEERGYRRVDQVDEPGQFAIKGGLLDVFSPALDQPCRLEFFADTLQKIKTFSADTQLSTGERSSLWISPLWEGTFPKERRAADAQRLYEALLEQPLSSADRQGLVDAFAAGHYLRELPIFLPALRDGARACLWDYVQPDDTIVFLEPLAICLEKYRNAFDRWQADYEEDLSAKRPVLPPQDHFLSVEQIQERIQARGQLAQIGLELSGEETKQLVFQSPMPAGWDLPQVHDRSALNLWLEHLKDLPARGHRIVILVRQDEHLLRVRSVLQHHGLLFENTKKKHVAFLKGEDDKKSSLVLAIGALPQMIWDEVLGLVVLPEHVLFGEGFQPTQTKRSKTRSVFKSFQDLEPNALVVHADHGIGRYLGMKTMAVGGIETDFLILEYADQDKIYLPVHRLNLLQKYAGEQGGALDKLKSQGWQKRKSRAKKAIRDMADQLLKIYAQRRLSQRSPYSAPGDMYFQFEADFPYSETDDQQKAIDEVNADLSGDLPMDRLICGDVGFGKTEVALRAAMRVALDGMQVIILAPTTLLSYQHYETFKARFRPYGVEVGLANRFVKAEKVKQSLEAFREGKVDVMVGTHRLLSKDVKPKNLGLLIVDEEQRFGVGHKETIKAFKAACDILTLTATPIPRSLHMSLLGIRDISTIATAPTERLSIKTYVAQSQPDLIRKAITQETQRGGQVFFVHNRVSDILEISAMLRQLLPGITIAVAHGQMKENNVESVIIDFIQQKFSVLVCTTIIESGIDMPNVNTIIVNNADKFGLAQLYQMRGRVGRSSRQSYAYFLTAGALADREDARQRLEILAAHQELGVGFQIASYDMEMRGTGNLLGGEQSGHMEDIGYEMYLDMLEREMAAMRGQEKDPEIDPEIKIPVSASLPATYIPQERQRLALYKSLFSAQVADDVHRLRQETVDRFGNLPQEAYNLFQVALLKVLLRSMRVEQLQLLKAGVYEFRMAQLKAEQIRRLTEASSQRPERLHLTADFRLIINLQAKSPTEELQELIETVLPLTLA